MSRELSADGIRVRVAEMPDRRWVAYPNYSDRASAARLPYQMPQHESDQQATAFARASIAAAQANVAGTMATGDAVKYLASRVSSIGEDFEFSARAKWAAGVLKCRRDEERIVEVETSSADITERRGAGTQTLVVTVSLVSLYGDRRTEEVRIRGIEWRNVSRGGQIVEERYVPAREPAIVV